MIACHHCGQANTPDTNFCRYCGNRLSATAPQPQRAQDSPPTAPRPYAWKTDEFQTTTEARRTSPVGLSQAASAPAPAPYNAAHVAQSFRCPRCATTFPPRVEKRISTGGWITFAVLIVVFFPLFWIGLLIKEEVVQCQGCNLKLN